MPPSTGNNHCSTNNSEHYAIPSGIISNGLPNPGLAAVNLDRVQPSVEELRRPNCGVGQLRMAIRANDKYIPWVVAHFGIYVVHLKVW